MPVLGPMKYIGIDEAGRGPVIGPMIIAGISVDSNDLELLREKGVKDSKMLSKSKIFELGAWLEENYKYIAIKVEPEEIDSSNNINQLELEKFVEIINKLEGEVVIVDAPSSNPKRVENELRKRANKEIIAENFADKNYLQVGAASIIAKMEREKEIERIKKEINIDFGSGYPSDEKTKQFLREIIRKGELSKFSKIIRKSWYTTQPKLSYYS